MDIRLRGIGRSRDPIVRLAAIFRVSRPSKFAVTYMSLFILSHGIFFAVVYQHDPTSIEAVLKDYLAYWNVFYSVCVIPPVAFFYAWMYPAVDTLFRDLAKSDVWIDGSQRRQTRRQCRQHERALSTSWVPTICSALIVGGGMLWEVFDSFFHNHSFLSPYRGGSWFVTKASCATIAPIAAVGYHLVVVILARGLMAVRGLRRVFRDREIKLQPMHPDKCGGIGCIGDYALRVSYFIAFLGVGVSIAFVNSVYVGKWEANYLVIFSALAYLLLSPIVFFMTLGAAHNRMLDAKKALQKMISDQFSKDYSQLSAKLGESSEVLTPHVEKVDQLRKLYELTESFRVWPFDATSLQRFWAAFLSPLMPILVGILLWKSFAKW